MDSSPPEAAETLSRSLSSSSGDRSSSLPPSDPPPPLSKTSSFSKLNAKAPEFVPRTSSSPSLAASSASASSSPLLSPTSLSSLSSPSSAGNLVSLAQQQSDLAASFGLPRTPGPPALMHVYNSTAQVQPLEPPHYSYGYGVQFYGGIGGGLDRQHDLSVLASSALAHTPVMPPTTILVNSDSIPAAASLNNGLSDEAAQKLMKQASM